MNKIQRYEWGFSEKDKWGFSEKDKGDWVKYEDIKQYLPKTYRIGQLFKSNGDESIWRLRSSGNHYVFLAEVGSYALWRPAVKVIDLYHISEEEFNQVCCLDDFELIEETNGGLI